MKSIIRWPRLCTRCGSLEHFSENCPMQLGVTDAERTYDANTRRGAQQILALITFMALAHIGIALWFGVEP